MNLTELNEKQKGALILVSTNNSFAGKVALTVLNNGWYSEKQAAIINNEVASMVDRDVVCGVSVTMDNIDAFTLHTNFNIHDHNADAMRRQMPSSMR